MSLYLSCMSLSHCSIPVSSFLYLHLNVFSMFYMWFYYYFIRQQTINNVKLPLFIGEKCSIFLVKWVNFLLQFRYLCCQVNHFCSENEKVYHVQSCINLFYGWWSALFRGSHYIWLLKEHHEFIPILRFLPTNNPTSPGKVCHTIRVYSPTLFKHWCGFFHISQEPDI